MMNVNVKLALKYALFIGFMLLTWRVSTAITWRMNYDFENNAFKQTAIQGVVKDFILSKKKKRRAIVIEYFGKTTQVLAYEGCDFIDFKYSANIGDTVFKQASTFRIRLKSTFRDTIINEDL
jgi:hypothetical protein